MPDTTALVEPCLRRHVPAPLRGAVAAFSFTGAAAQEEITRFLNGRKRYLCAVLRKPATG